MKALVGAFNQEKALVGTFSVIVQPVVEPIDRFAALDLTLPCLLQVALCASGRVSWRRAVLHVVAQYLGAGLGGAAVLGLYWDALRWHESQTGGYRWGQSRS